MVLVAPKLETLAALHLNREGLTVAPDQLVATANQNPEVAAALQTFMDRLLLKRDPHLIAAAAADALNNSGLSVAPDQLVTTAESNPAVNAALQTFMAWFHSVIEEAFPALAKPQNPVTLPLLPRDRAVLASTHASALGKDGEESPSKQRQESR